MIQNSALKRKSLALIDFSVMLIIQLASVMLISDQIGAAAFSLYNVLHVVAFALVNLIGMAAFGV